MMFAFSIRNYITFILTCSFFVFWFFVLRSKYIGLSWFCACHYMWIWNWSRMIFSVMYQVCFIGHYIWRKALLQEMQYMQKRCTHVYSPLNFQSNEWNVCANNGANHFSCFLGWSCMLLSWMIQAQPHLCCLTVLWCSL